jgi:hypothetical protein
VNTCRCGMKLPPGAAERGIVLCRACRPREGGAWLAVQVKRLRELAHLPRREIAARLGRSQRAITCAAKRYGVTLSGRFIGRWPDATVRRCRAMRAAGLSVKEISEATGVPRWTLKNWFYLGYRPLQSEQRGAA